MKDRVHPSAKPTANNGGGVNPSFPATKAQMYNATRPVYRPQPRRRGRRGGSGSCCFWIIIVVALFLLLSSVTGAALWFFYRPHRPTFSVSSLQISELKLTSSSQMTSKFNVAVNVYNPNKKLELFYDPISVSILADEVGAGDGSMPAFEQGAKNTTTLKTSITSAGQSVDSGSGTELKSDLKRKSSLALKIQMESKVKVKIGGFKTKKLPIRVVCDGITASLPTRKTVGTAAISGSECEVDLRVKIWKWTF